VHRLYGAAQRARSVEYSNKSVYSVHSFYSVASQLHPKKERRLMAKHQSWNNDSGSPQAVSYTYGVFEKELYLRRGVNDIVSAYVSKVATQLPRLLIGRVFKWKAAICI
jgi:hypothetical protein